MFCKMWVYINFWLLKRTLSKRLFQKLIKKLSFLFEFLYKTNMLMSNFFRNLEFSGQGVPKCQKPVKFYEKWHFFGTFENRTKSYTFFQKFFKKIFFRKKRFLCYFIIFLKPAWNRVFLGGAGRHFLQKFLSEKCFLSKCQKENLFENIFSVVLK